ncbi:methyltransferase domain-containing protein [Microcystis elabens FACHB-917]|nr:methyltransferase domain-containing protein [Microcystis elabens FACHB-917]
MLANAFAAADPFLNGFEQHVFTELAPFQALWRAEHQHWPEAVQRRLKGLALAGLRDPLSDQPVPPQHIAVLHPNCRETITADGVVSRQRAQLLVLRQLIEAGELPPLAEQRLYLNEAVTGYADYLRQRCLGLRCSEYLPEPDHPLRGKVAHRDVRRLNLPPASMQCLICNEVLEHVEELLPALESMAAVLTLGGYLLATVPLAYGQQASIVKAVWRGEGQEPELLMEAEWHGDPVNAERGSLVYRIPGWDLLDQLKAAGFRRAELHAISSQRYGVLGAELPYVFVVVAQR